MAILMFSTSAGLAMDLHYCGGEFQNFSLFKTAKSCHEKAIQKKSCHHSQEKIDKEEKKDCCENESFFFQLDEDYTTHAQIDIEEKKPLSKAIAVSSMLPQTVNVNYAKFYKNYKPPLLAIDSIVDFQSFLL